MENAMRNPATVFHSKPTGRNWLLVGGSLIGLAGIAFGLHLAGVFKPAVVNHAEDENARLSGEERARYKKKLAEAIAELDRTDPGWRLEDIEAKRPKVPDEENAALMVIAAAKDIPEKWPSPKVAAALSPVRNHRLPDSSKLLFEEELKKVPKALNHARAVADRETGQFPRSSNKDPVDAYFGMDAIADVMKLRSLFLLQSLVETEKGDLVEALRSSRALIAMGRSISDDGKAFDQTLRFGVIRQACDSIERVLAQAEPAERDLLATQLLLEKEARTSLYPSMVRGEFAHKHHFLDQIEGKDEVLEKLQQLVAMSGDKIGAGPLRDGLLVVHVDMFAFRKREMEVSRLPLHQRAQACEKLDADVKARLTNKALPLEAAVDWRLERADRLHQMRVRCTIAALAAERYRRKHGKWPVATTDLKNLADEAAMIDPGDGQPLRFKPTKEGLIIYSIGVDGKDDGGEEIHGLRIEGDVTVRLWDVKHRGLPPMAEKPEPQEP